ncbi:hypothetical protein FSP39_001124 [Pinctada imbricata]|uniref:EF-hand domain-containing protein n=1 Tax=Pinctada imbricata TaxID=66713 RepID=A0AA88Y1Y1_PINIB|nr:hypothetical protein FSP39_001124 [Pinctada imbricata]
MKEVFSLFDHDCDGFLDIKELGKVLRSFGLNPSEAELEEMITEYEEDGKNYGKMDFPEVMKILAKKIKEPPETEEYLREAFRTFDKDGSGVISRIELQQIMSNQGEKLSEHEVQEMMADADDGKGEVHYEGER